jgi:hypothetical protein
MQWQAYRFKAVLEKQERRRFRRATQSTGSIQTLPPAKLDRV